MPPTPLGISTSLLQDITLAILWVTTAVTGTLVHAFSFVLY